MGKFFTWLPHIDKIIRFIEDQSGKIYVLTYQCIFLSFKFPIQLFLKIIHICIIRLPE